MTLDMDRKVNCQKCGALVDKPDAVGIETAPEKFFFCDECFGQREREAGNG